MSTGLSMDRGNRETDDRRKLSLEICSLMENVGHGDEMRRFRIQEYDNLSKSITSIASSTFGVSTTNTGSKAEGLSLPLQGDIDIMCVFNDSVCVDEPSVSDGINILRAEYNDMTPPGYVHVTAFELNSHLSSGTNLSSRGLITGSFLYTNESGQKLVSSSIFRNFFNQIHSSLSFSNYDYIVEHSTSFNGPAVTKFISTQFHGVQAFELPSIDSVCAIFFYSSTFLEPWKQRPRYHHWPSSALLEDVAQSEGYIVPIGSVESNLPGLEWRVSYVTAEQKLMRSLNPTQAKLFVLLKMISKELLGSEGSAISSYVMKNVVLWVCELYGGVLFVPYLLSDQVSAALFFLKLCLQNNHVPNYIIPERNLIAGRLSLQSKTNLIARLSDLLKNRTFYYELNIFKKHFSMLFMPQPCIQSYGKKRDTIEKLCLLDLSTGASFCKPGFIFRTSMLQDVFWEYFKDERFMKIRYRLANMIVPEWITLSTNPLELIKLFLERLKTYLS